MHCWGLRAPFLRGSEFLGPQVNLGQINLPECEGRISGEIAELMTASCRAAVPYRRRPRSAGSRRCSEGQLDEALGKPKTSSQPLNEAKNADTAAHLMADLGPHHDGGSPLRIPSFPKLEL